MKIQPDSLPIRFLTKVCDLMILNILLAQFDNTFPRHFGNATKLAAANLPVTFLMTLVNLLPVLLTLLLPELVGYFAAFWVLIGFAAGAHLNSFYLNRVFGLKSEEIEANE